MWTYSRSIYYKNRITGFFDDKYTQAVLVYLAMERNTDFAISRILRKCTCRARTWIECALFVGQKRTDASIALGVSLNILVNCFEQLFLDHIDMDEAWAFLWKHIERFHITLNKIGIAGKIVFPWRCALCVQRILDGYSLRYCFISAETYDSVPIGIVYHAVDFVPMSWCRKIVNHLENWICIRCVVLRTK